MNSLRRFQSSVLFCGLASLQLGCGALSGFQNDNEEASFFWAGDPRADGGVAADATAFDGGIVRGDASEPNDAGQVDGGVRPADGGTLPDGGTTNDGGGSGPDAGAWIDAGAGSPCAPGLHLENDDCVPNSRLCPFPHGTGVQTWSSNGWGVCTASSCDFGYHLALSVCESNVRSCMLDGTDGTETWQNGSWGACNPIHADGGIAEDGPTPGEDAGGSRDAGETAADSGTSFEDGGTLQDGGRSADAGEPTEDAGAVMDAGVIPCPDGQHAENEICVSDVRACSDLVGTGTQTWTGTSWSACTLTGCDPDYHFESGVCVFNTRPCGQSSMGGDGSFGAGSQEWNHNDWQACTCEEGYHYDLGTRLCQSNARNCEVTNGSGLQTWTGSAWGSCAEPSCWQNCESGVCWESCMGTDCWSTCAVATCDAGYHAESGMCAPDTRVCSSEGQFGIEVWSGSEWGMCRISVCGNGTIEPNEECDDGNSDNHDSCLTSCRTATCGDGYVFASYEECDDGNAANGDGCNESCLVEDSYRCGGTPTLCATEATSYEWDENSGPPSIARLQNGVTTVFVRVDQEVNLKLDFSVASDDVVGPLTIVGDEGVTLRSENASMPVLEFRNYPQSISIYNLDIYGTTAANATGNGVIIVANDLTLENVRILDVKNGIISTSGDVRLRNVEIQSVEETAVSVTSGNTTLRNVQIRDVKNGVVSNTGKTKLVNVHIQRATGIAVEIHSSDLTLRRTEISESNLAIQIADGMYQGRTSETRIFHSWVHDCTGFRMIRLRGNTWMANSVLSKNSGAEIFRTEQYSNTLVALSTFYQNTGASVLHTHGNLFVVASLFENNAGPSETHAVNAILHFKRSHVDQTPVRDEGKGAAGYPKNENEFSAAPELYCHDSSGCLWERNIPPRSGPMSFEPQASGYTDVLQEYELLQFAVSLQPEELLPAACVVTESANDEASGDVCWQSLFGDRTDFHGTTRAFGGGIEPGAVEITSLASENSGVE